MSRRAKIVTPGAPGRTCCRCALPAAPLPPGWTATKYTLDLCGAVACLDAYLAYWVPLWFDADERPAVTAALRAAILNATPEKRAELLAGADAMPVMEAIARAVGVWS